MNKAHKTTDT